MRKIILDIEGNNLFPAVTVLHCAVATDLVDNTTHKFLPSDMLDGTFTKFLDECDFIACHYGIGFDFPAMEQVLGWTPAKKEYLFDTLTMSRLLNPDRPIPRGCKGAHGVDAWGTRMGIPKPKYEQWEFYDDEMLHRCTQDTLIQTNMFRMLCQEAGFNIDLYDPRLPEGYATGAPNWADSLKQELMSSYIMFKQASNGCNFEYEKALEYQETLERYSQVQADYILRNVSQTPKQIGVTILAPYKMNGEFKKTVLDWELDDIVGPFTRIEWETMNLNSHIQVKDWLYSLGWVPDEWNYKKKKSGGFEKDENGDLIKTSPIISESSLEEIDGLLGAAISARTKSNHKKNQIKGLLKRTNVKTMRIPAEANPQGTNTGRMKHIGVANLPKVTTDKTGDLVWFPDKQLKFFGTEMRSMFSAPEGRDFVGYDASGIEFRCFAHYVGDMTLIDLVLNGDIHTHNQEMAKLATRDQAKTFIYALLFGAGDAKLGVIMCPDGTPQEMKAAGAAAKAAYLKAVPLLAKLLKDVQKAAMRGYLKGLDGRCVFMRRNDRGAIAKNKALNTLCQSAGAVIMTYSRIWLWNECDKRGWIADGRALKVIDMHDESQWEVDPEITEEIMELMELSLVKAGEHYNFKIPLAAEAKVGRGWHETH